MFLHLCMNTAGAVNYSYLQHVCCLSPCSVTAWHVSDLKLFVLPPIDPWYVVSALCLWFDSICTVDEETRPTVRFSGFWRAWLRLHTQEAVTFSLSLIVTVQPANHSAKMQMRHDTGKEVQHEANLQQQTSDLLQLLCVWGSLHSPANSKLYYNL